MYMISIKNLFKYLFSFPKKYIISFIVVAVIIASYFYFRDGGDIEHEFIVAERGNLEQVVSVTGKVKPSDRVDLAFETTGRVNKINVDVGDIVYSGQRLASLDSSQYQAQYNQAKATADAEKSNLDELKRGTREEEIDVQKTKVENAEQSLLDKKNSLMVKIKDSFTKSDDAVRNQTGQLFDSPRSSDPQLIIETDYSLDAIIESGRVGMENLLDEWSNSLTTDAGILNSISSYTNTAKNNLNEVSSFLNEVSLAVNGLVAGSTLTQTVIDGYKTDVATARTNVNTALSNLITAEENFKTAESDLSLVRQQLVLKEAGSTQEEINEQESKVKSAEANVKNYESLIAKTIIYSPMKGTITKKDVSVGEIVQSNTAVLTVISDDEFEIEAFVPEADIAKVSVEDMATITLDAYSDDEIEFEAKIISIDPAETVIEGVSTYRTKLQFVEKDERIKSGMTANIDILTATKENVISVPYRALHFNGRKYVEVLDENNEVIEKEVETGLRSTEGSLEIISGLEEGDRIITSK
ncbi:efflux RND transporter periplasmic adaptor subunit [Patescibacteria group bacterium]